MEDRYGHRISYLRVSITDRCNERCRYCLPVEEQEWLPRGDVLSYEEILRVIRVGAGLGIRKVRVTGGEPLTRRDALWFFEQLGRIEMVFEPAGDGAPPTFSVRVPDDQPEGPYYGLLLDPETSLPAGTVSLRIEADARE